MFAREPSRRCAVASRPLATGSRRPGGRALCKCGGRPHAYAVDVASAELIKRNTFAARGCNRLRPSTLLSLRVQR
jgi:hypothetical protein